MAYHTEQPLSPEQEARVWKIVAEGHAADHRRTSVLTFASRIAGADGALLSTRLVCDALMAAGDVAHGFVELFPEFLSRGLSGAGVEISPDFIEAVFGDAESRSAGDALVVTLKPSDRYLAFVSALGRELDVPCDRDGAHGWPILSVVPSPTTLSPKGSGVQPGPGRAAIA